MLSQAAFNAFLKTLEEPPAHAIFILATTEKHKIIPTILSRCQIFDFNRIKVEDIVKYLQEIAKKEKVSYEIEALNIIAQKAEGAMRDALSIFDQVVNFSNNNITYQKVIENLNVLDYQYYFTLTDNFLEGEYPATLNIFDELLSKGFDIQQFITGLSSHFRNLLICKDPQTASILEVGAAIAEKYIQIAQKCSPEFLIKVLDIINQTDVTFRQSSNQRLHVELMLIRLCGINTEKKNISPYEIIEEKAIDELSILSDRKSEDNYVQPLSAENNEEIATPPVPLKSQPKSISIKNAILGKEKEEIKAPVDIDENAEQVGIEINEEDISGEVLVFTQLELENHWQGFIDSSLSGKPGYASLLKNYLPDIGEDFSLNIVFETQLQVDMFREVKYDLETYLRKKLDNKLININESKQENGNQVNKLYTVEDKFRYLSQKHPSVTKLKQQLNLDFE
jgi:DNA polymerase-3 subunit gamma/tau